MGWEYANGADMSGYKYLVVKLKKPQNCDAHLNIFTANSIWSDCCATSSFGSRKQIVVNLSTAKYTSGHKTGKALETDNVRIVSFWSNGQGTIVVDDMYLTNNSDYSREVSTGIGQMENGELKMENTAVYDLSGRKVANGSSSLGTPVT